MSRSALLHFWEKFAAVGYQAFENHISKQKWMTQIHHNRQADDLWAHLEVLEYVGFGHDWTLRNHPALHKPVSSDTASENATKPPDPVQVSFF